MTQSTEVRSEVSSLPRREPGRSEIDVQEVGRALRRFVRGSDRMDETLERVGEGWLPALLHRYRDEGHVRTPFPFYLPDARLGGEGGEPLDSLLRRALTGLELDAGDARVLTDNLPRFEKAIRAALEGRTGRIPFQDVAGKAGASAVQGLSDHVRPVLEKAWTVLVSAVPPGELLPFGGDVPLELWIHAAETRAHAVRSTLVAELSELRRRTRERLALELTDETESVRGLGGGPDVLDPSALARVSKKRSGRVGLDPARRDALLAAVEVIEGFLQGAASPALLVVETGESRTDAVRRTSGVPEMDGNSASAEAAADDHEAHTSTSSVWVFTDPDPSSRALELFLREADAWTEIVQAIRRCELEVEGTFDPARHEPVLGAITRDSLTQEELALLPPVLAVESSVRLRGRGLSALSRVLRSGWPVHVLVSIDPFDDTEPDRYRLELGYIGMGHRRAAVHQGTASEPADLIGSFARLSGRLEPSLHIIATANTDAEPGPWLHLGAAVEGRAHPVFIYDPGTGRSWSERFDFGGNPATEIDWPVYPFAYQPVDESVRQQSLELAFTFVDFALLDRSARDHFRIIPDGFEHDDLVPVAEALESSELSHTPRIPYVWAVGGEGRLTRLATTEAMLRGSRDRLDFWWTLQELAGVRNAYVQSAVARAEGAAAERAETERQEREAKFQGELDEARESAVKDALGGVAQFLLGMGDAPQAFAGGFGGAVGGLVGGTTAGAGGIGSAGASAGATVDVPTSTPSTEEAPVQPSAPAPAAPAADAAEDPWVDTPLCTSCNDCVQINPRLFVYDENKQVRIGDPEAGTFADLVKAAEKCPSRCIHTGTPLNADEPGLSELVERAKAFR